MSHLMRVFAVLAITAIAGGRAKAQGLVTQRSLSLEMAKTMAEAALAECKAKGFHTAVAVVDRSGRLLVFLRDEQAGPETAEMAQRKAYTALVFRRPTIDWVKRTMPDQPIAGQREVTGVIALGGGVPVQVGTETIGGIASSGSSPENDDACAKAGIAKVADLLK